jgi:HK97 gp10 family phage protein
MAKARVKIEWAGMNELLANYRKCGVALDDKSPAVKDIILKPASAAIENARNLAPLGTITTPQHKPGTLRRSLLATRGPKTQRGIYMVARKRIAPYATYVELGTSKMTARPFFRPAMLVFGSTYVSDIAPEVKTLLETTAAANAYHPPA